MDKGGVITINNFQRGTSPSAFVGFPKMVGLNIYQRPGIIQPGVRLSRHTSYTLTGMPTCEAIDASGNVYVGTDDGRLYKNGFEIRNGLGVVHDIAIYRNHLIISRSGTGIDVYGPLSGPTYYAGWKTGLNTSTYGYKKIVVGQDDIVYIANEGDIATIASDFAAGSPPTATFTASAFTAPDSKIIQTMCEYGQFLMIMTSVNEGNYGQAVLYPWDRVSIQPEKGIAFKETKIRTMYGFNNNLFIVSQNSGIIYESNLTDFQVKAEIPNRLPLQTFTTYPNSITGVGNEIIFGLGGPQSSVTDTPYGVYSLRGNSLITKHLISTGNESTAISIGSIANYANDQYHVGWKDTSSYGLDEATYALGTGYTVYFESPIYETGTYLNKRTYQTLQVNLGRNLYQTTIGTPAGIRIKYRTSEGGAWTTLGTYTYSTYGAVNNFMVDFPVADTTQIQIRCEFDTGTSTSYGDNIELRSIILI